MQKSIWAKIICFAIVVMTFNFTSIAQNQTTNNQEWKLIKTKKKGEGWHLYKSKVAGSKFREFKVVGKINCSMQKAQTNSMKLFVDSTAYITKKGKSLGWFKVFKHTEDEIELYSFMKGGFLVKDRDVVVRYRTFEDSTGNALGVKWHQIDKEGYEATDEIIRMPVDKGNWRFEKIDSKSCMAEMTFQFQPGGNPPAWMINTVSKSVIPHELEHLRELCK